MCPEQAPHTLSLHLPHALTLQEEMSATAVEVNDLLVVLANLADSSLNLEALETLKASLSDLHRDFFSHLSTLLIHPLILW